MSRWGEGIFESDRASNHLIILIGQIIESIESCISTSNIGDIEALVYRETYFMSGIDILLTLGKAYPDILHSTLAELPIAQWREWYLKVFDEDESNSVNSEFTKGRREIIVKTFLEFEEQFE